MPVLSDKWITRMAKDKGMISPFEENRLEEIAFLMEFHHTGMTQE